MALLLDQFADELLSQHVFDKLRLYVDNVSHGDLIAELAVNCSYATGARCLRRLIGLRMPEYERRDALPSRVSRMFRRFPPPWAIDERQESFIVKDADGQRLAYLPKLPGVPRQILKDIPRPPDSASRDD